MTTKRFDIQCTVCDSILGSTTEDANPQNALCNKNLCSIVYEKHLETNKIKSNKLDGLNK